MPTGSEYTLADLASLAGTTPRTVRYYIALGLLAPPGHAGPGARYGDGHLARLRLIRKLQKEHQPLAEIRARMAGLQDGEVEELLGQPTEAVERSALEYIRGVLGSAAPSPRRPASLARRVSVEPAPPAMPGSVPSLGTLQAPLFEPAPLAPGRSAQEPPMAAEPAPVARSQWDRISLSPDVEIHVRRPLSRLANRRVERLITIARELLEEDQP